MSKLHVSLTSAAGKQPFTGHQVSASFKHRVTVGGSAEPWEVPGVVTTAVDADGRAVLVLPEKDALVGEAGIALRVLAPDGQVLAFAEAPLDAVDDAGRPVEIKVNPKEVFPIERNTDPAYLKPEKVRGLVVDPAGRQRVGDRQVVLRAKPSVPAGAAPRVVAVARTDGRGYFSAAFPLGAFADADALVDGGPPAPVALNDDGSFPDRLVVGLELPPPGREGDRDGDDRAGCDCETDVPRDPDNEDLVNSPGTYSSDAGGGHCADITKPNRVLEEFDFHAVVRTTEPHIRGLTVKEPPKIGLDDIIRIIDPKVLASRRGHSRKSWPGRTPAAPPPKVAALLTGRRGRPRSHRAAARSTCPTPTRCGGTRGRFSQSWSTCPSSSA